MEVVMTKGGKGEMVRRNDLSKKNNTFGSTRRY